MKALTYYVPRPDVFFFFFLFFPPIRGIEAWNRHVQATSRLDLSLREAIDKVKVLALEVPVIKYKLLVLVIQVYRRSSY